MSQVIRTIISCLPVIANALSRKYSVLVEFGSPRACTTRGSITFPAQPAGDQKAKVLANGHVDHEASHMLLTDLTYMEMCRTALGQDLSNFLEDVRVERAMRQPYPDCKFNLRRRTILLVEEREFRAPSAG